MLSMIISHRMQSMIEFKFKPLCLNQKKQWNTFKAQMNIMKYYTGHQSTMNALTWLNGLSLSMEKLSPTSFDDILAS